MKRVPSPVTFCRPRENTPGKVSPSNLQKGKSILFDTENASQKSKRKARNQKKQYTQIHKPGVREYPRVPAHTCE